MSICTLAPVQPNCWRPCRNAASRFRIVVVPVYEHTDPPLLLGLLRPDRKRPYRGCATNCFDKVAPPHCAPYG
jgi:hypothetical protein